MEDNRQYKMQLKANKHMESSSTDLRDWDISTQYYIDYTTFILHKLLYGT